MRKGMNPDLYREEWQWQEGDLTVTRSCQWSGPGCHQGCNVLFYTKDDKLVKIEGDPRSPVNEGRLCMRCLAMVEAVNHPDRILHPLRRVGERGENKWEEITMDEAYALIAEKAREVTEEFGPKSIVTGIGTGRNATWQTSSLAFAGFKTPNDTAGMLVGRLLLHAAPAGHERHLRVRLHRRLRAAFRRALRRSGIPPPRRHPQLGVQPGRLQRRRLLRALDRRLHAARLPAVRGRHARDLDGRPCRHIPASRAPAPMPPWPWASATSCCRKTCTTRSSATSGCTAWRPWPTVPPPTRPRSWRRYRGFPPKRSWKRRATWVRPAPWPCSGAFRSTRPSGLWAHPWPWQPWKCSPGQSTCRAAS